MGRTKDRMYRFLILVFLLGLFLSPLVYWPGAEVAYEVPRVWFIQRWIEVLGVLGCLLAFRLLRRSNLDIGLMGLVIAFVVVAVFSSLLGSDIGKSVWGNYYRADGLITLFHLVVFFFFTLLYWQKWWRRYVAYAIVCGSVLVSVWAVIDGVRFYVVGDYSASLWGGPIGVSFGNPNFLAGYLSVTLPFVWYLLVERVNFRGLFFIGGILQVVAIILTQAWGGILTLLLFLSLLVSFRKKGGWVFLVLAFLGIFVFAGRRMVVIDRLDEFPAAERRERIFRRVLLGVVEKPLLGYGWANVDYAFEAVDWPVRFDNDVYVDKAHSVLLEVLAATGVVGLVIYILIVVRVLVVLVGRLRCSFSDDLLWSRVLMLTLVLYVFHSQTNIISIGEELVFWLVLGVISSEV